MLVAVGEGSCIHQRGTADKVKCVVQLAKDPAYIREALLTESNVLLQLAKDPAYTRETLLTE